MAKFVETKMNLVYLTEDDCNGGQDLHFYNNMNELDQDNPGCNHWDIGDVVVDLEVYEDGTVKLARPLHI